MSYTYLITGATSDVGRTLIERLLQNAPADTLVLAQGCGDLEKPVSKGKTYQFSRAITAKFREKNGSLVCRDLKGIETGTPLRSCEGCILDAAALVEELLLDQENK